ncbi:THUMP domain-containing protein 2 [Armadillidium nasatum]|uniref:THUMP domain-containing protein 2 n=1 Tax=Armadillidium nasatum TaxID=96803 RepID=A0A5N5T545_9CRUS|nr:THUMP domain-containing protein 2 [Armadillidium nasatum]
MDIITKIKSQHTKSEWKMCLNPDQCYAYINRQKEKEKIRSKRKLEMTKFEENVMAGMSNDIKFSRPNIDAGSKSETFRVSCRIRGKWKKYSSSVPFAKAVSEHIIEEKKWILHNNSPKLDIYINMNDECIIVGASLTDKPLSLRPYMSHITLRSTICHIIVKASKIMQGFTVLDPMCGSGSILLEAAMCIKELNIIACDIDSNKLLSAQCNLREIGQASIILSDTSSIPLLSSSVDAIICDFPFGQKHTTSKPYQSLLIKMIRESKRVLRTFF